MIAASKNILDKTLENDYIQSILLEHRKKYAQFFTPLPVADLMARWLLGNENLETVLEPAFGLGIFTRTLLQRRGSVKIKGFDVDPIIFDRAMQYFDQVENVDLFLEDYMFADWENKYDGIICNPTYFKFHDYDNKKAIKEMETRLGCKLNGLTNLYALFLLKSIRQLNPGGRCAYIIPSEFLNSDYGKLVKTALLESKTLRHVMVVNFEESVFDDALTTACLVFCANDVRDGKVQFAAVRSLKDLNKMEDAVSRYPDFSDSGRLYSFSELNPAIKWKAYYQAQNGIRFKNLVPFSFFAKVTRGIATGSNDYFVFNQSKAKIFSIDDRYLAPCICRAADAKTPFFTNTDFEKLKSADKNVFLLNAVHSTDELVEAYLKKGEAEKVHQKFLTASRNPWYALENRPPAPIWAGVFNRTGLSFIRNEANILNLTSYHCIYPKQASLFEKTDADLLFAYLLTPTAKEIFTDNGREYGAGLQKFEPNDLNKGMVLDLRLLSEQQKTEILGLYRQFRIEILEDRNGAGLIQQIDKIFKDQFSI